MKRGEYDGRESELDDSGDGAEKSIIMGGSLGRQWFWVKEANGGDPAAFRVV